MPNLVRIDAADQILEGCGHNVPTPGTFERQTVPVQIGLSLTQSLWENFGDFGAVVDIVRSSSNLVFGGFS